MAPYRSLAQHLQQAATQFATNPALIRQESVWSFAELLSDAQSLSQKIKASQRPFVFAGSKLNLLRHTYACSLQNRPFWPVHRSSQSIDVAHNDALPIIDKLPPDVALIIATSGSEGQPRPVLLGNVQLDSAAAAANQHLQLAAGDLWLNCLPLVHIGGLSILWRCARAGAGVVLHDDFDIERINHDLQHYPVTHISLVPAMLAQLLATNSAPPAHLRVALIGGAALTQHLYDKACALGWPLYPSYGMTETAALIACFDPNDGDWQTGQVGQAMAGHDIRIDQNGQICLRGPQVMLHYLDGSGVDPDGWLTTSDLGSIDPAGYLTVSGRADDMMLSGGNNVHPLEVEACLAACPGVTDVAVTSQADPVWGDLIVALVVGSAKTQQLFDHARQHLPTAALPRKIIFLDRLPRNAAGKLERATLRQLAA